MSENEQPRITLKAGAGYDAPWVTVPFNDPDEANSKLDGIVSSGLLEKVASTAQLFHGVYAAGPITQQAPPVQQEAPAPQAAWGTVNPQAPGNFQPAQQGQQWNSGQQAPPQQQGPQGTPGATLHPEGKQCPMDGKPLEYKKTQNGKGKWQCPDWRWNNGNPNGHAMDWAN